MVNKRIVFLVLFVCISSTFLFSSGKKEEIKDGMNNEMINYKTEREGEPVFFTKDISSDGLLKIYKALEWESGNNVAIKLSTGEPPNSNYLRPELIEGVVKEVNGTIVECNTAYGGSRASNALHYQVAKDHGFLDIAPFCILDENGSITLKVENGKILKENYVGSHFF